jgi:hypothetical protein
MAPEGRPRSPLVILLRRSVRSSLARGRFTAGQVARIGFMRATVEPQPAAKVRPTDHPVSWRKVLSYSAVSWTSLYVASKLQYAVEGRLGVTGGPTVADSAYHAYGSGEVGLAQWANAAVGVLIAFALLTTVLPLGRQLNRWVLLVPLWTVSLVVSAGSIAMIVRALVTDAGGELFGAYCAVWGGLIIGATVTYQQWRKREHTRHS